jgi:hypothetical protein
MSEALTPGITLSADGSVDAAAERFKQIKQEIEESPAVVAGGLALMT